MKFAATIVLAIALAACGSTNPADDVAARAARAEMEAKKQWFCQVGTDDESWECVDDPGLVQDPQPERLPSAATAPPEPAVTEPFEEPAQPPQTDLADAPPPARQPSERLPEEPAAAESAPTIPRYQQLAYQPEEAVSLLDLPQSFWAAQLIALATKEELEAYADEHHLVGMSAARVAVAGNLFYVLLLGIYETRELAEAATADLPPPFDVDPPWLRSVGSLQKAILAGNELAGSPEV
jgi:septal ring-binding cell division protein DamX